MSSKIHYLFCFILISIGMFKLWINLQRPDLEGIYGLGHWVIVALMFAGAIYQYNKATEMSG